MLLGAGDGPRVILLLGGPGAGKGTQASRLAQVLGMPHVSSGELLRDLNRDADTPMRTGELLPDDVAKRAVAQRLEVPDAARGAILDGFPRTVAQAKALDDWLARRGGSVGAVIYLEVPRVTMVERVVDRGKVSQRADDRADVADRRADIFEEELPRLIDYYERRGVVDRVNGAQSIEQVQQQIIAALERRLPTGH